MTDNPNPEAPEGGDKPTDDQTFTQADVDRIVKERVQRERAKYADYDDLKKQAEGAKTAEERITALENEIGAARFDAALSRIVNEFALTEKQAAALKYAPSEEAARELAEGFAAESSERKKSNHVPREGKTPSDSKKHSSWSGVLAQLDEQRT